MKNDKYYRITCLPRVDELDNIFYYSDWYGMDSNIDMHAASVFTSYVIEVMEKWGRPYCVDNIIQTMKEFTYKVKEISKEEYRLYMNLEWERADEVL